MRCRVAIGLVLVVAGMPQPGIAEWTFLGLGARSVTTLELHGGMLYAGTTTGLHVRPVDAADTLWMSLGLEDEHVLALLVFDSRTLLAGTRLGAFPDTVSLLRTTDGGVSWSAYQNGFGSVYQEVRALEALPGSDMDLLGAGGAGIEKSVDGGRTWRPVVAGSLTNFVQANPRAPAQVWAGGETLIFAPVMHRSLDAGDTWQTFHLEADGDNACDAIAFHPADPNVVYVGMEGRVMRTTDGGGTWETMTSPNPNLYYLGMAIPARMPLRIYAAGAAQPAGRGFILHESDDGGVSWTPIADPAPLHFGILALLLVTDGDTDTLFAGTDRGVYRYREIVSAVVGRSWTAVKKGFR
jgi:photosystem II stability/assembly factor-like uncharacterized protein